MPDVKGTALMPKGEPNGLAAIADELLKDPLRKRAALIIFDLKRGNEDYDQHDVIATVRIRRIEPLLSADLDTAELMIRRAAEARITGGEQLTLEFEQAIEEAFKGLDPSKPDPGEADPGEPGDPGPPEPGDPGPESGPRGGKGRKT